MSRAAPALRPAPCYGCHGSGTLEWASPTTVCAICHGTGRRFVVLDVLRDALQEDEVLGQRSAQQEVGDLVARCANALRKRGYYSTASEFYHLYCDLSGVCDAHRPERSSTIGGAP